jgi:Zn finger protein HypA/HybF involved in hydrogenase expression
VNNVPKFVSLNESGLGCALTVLLVSLLLGAVGLGWVVNSVLILLALLAVAPILGFLGLRWWMKRNLVESDCPVCGYEFTSFKGSECRCPSCGESLRVIEGKFERISPPNTIDVDAVEVSVQVLED